VGFLFVIYGYVIDHILIELQHAIPFVFSVFYLCNINIGEVIEKDYGTTKMLPFAEDFKMKSLRMVNGS